MNDISHTPNTDQVVMPLYVAAVEDHGREKPLVLGAESFWAELTPMKEGSPQEGSWWELGAALVTPFRPSVRPSVLAVGSSQALGRVGDGEHNQIRCRLSLSLGFC